MMNPSLSIIMATYNRAHLIAETLQSITNQNFTDWECLIIDDGSTDNTIEILQPILVNDKRFHYLKRPTTYKKGLPGCRNYGLDLAKGNYIIFFDDDDIVHPQNLEVCLNELNSNQTIFFCHYQKQAFQGQFESSYVTSISSYTKTYSDANFLSKMVTNAIPVASCTILFRADCFATIRFTETLQYAEEWECFQRIFSNNYLGVLIDVVLYFNRKHPNSNTGEFYKNNLVRLSSKKEAVKLVAKNLVSQNKLSASIFKYLISIAIAFRDIQLLNTLLTIAKASVKKRLYLNLKFGLYPLWKQYKRIEMKLR